MPDSGGAPHIDASPRPGMGDHAKTEQPATGVLDELSRVVRSAHAAVTGMADLLSLEARRAGLALMWMAVVATIAAICIAASWLGLMVALAMWAVAAGLSPIAAVVVVALLNCIGGAVLLKVGVSMSRELLFPATRRQLAGAFPVKPSAP